ncbi:hypothetical protein D3C86_2254440 [compost metagenome]
MIVLCEDGRDVVILYSRDHAAFGARRVARERPTNEDQFKAFMQTHLLNEEIKF